MSLQFILSGGQSGAERGALDAAIEIGIPHGGFVGSGRLADDGRVPAHYPLIELESARETERTRHNVQRSDGTLLISAGPLSAGPCYARLAAEKAGRPCLRIDLDRISERDAPAVIAAWLREHGIRVLNVTGASAAEDAGIADRVRGIVKRCFFLELARSELPGVDLAAAPAEGPYRPPPTTVGQAVDRLQAELSLRECARIAAMEPAELVSLFQTVGTYVRNEFRLWLGNLELMADCRSLAGDPDLGEDGAAMYIIKVLWDRLRGSHRLRLVE